MKSTTHITVLLAFIIYGNAAPAAEPLRVLERGMDGLTEYYLVICPNTKRSTVTVTYDHNDAGEGVSPPRIVDVCMTSHNGTQKCQKHWQIDDAAKASCP